MQRHIKYLQFIFDINDIVFRSNNGVKDKLKDHFTTFHRLNLFQSYLLSEFLENSHHSLKIPKTLHRCPG